MESKRNFPPRPEKKYFKEKKEDDLLIFGVHAVMEAIKSGQEINKILIQKGISKDLFFELKDVTAGNNYFIQYVPVEKIDKLTSQNHQGVAAYISPVKYYKIEELIDEAIENDKKYCFLFLDRLTDVRNFGAIFSQTTVRGGRNRQCATTVLHCGAQHQQYRGREGRARKRWKRD